MKSSSQATLLLHCNAAKNKSKTGATDCSYYRIYCKEATLQLIYAQMSYTAIIAKELQCSYCDTLLFVGSLEGVNTKCHHEKNISDIKPSPCLACHLKAARGDLRTESG